MEMGKAIRRSSIKTIYRLFSDRQRALQGRTTEPAGDEPTGSVDSGADSTGDGSASSSADQDLAVTVGSGESTVVEANSTGDARESASGK